MYKKGYGKKSKANPRGKEQDRGGFSLFLLKPPYYLPFLRSVYITSDCFLKRLLFKNKYTYT